MTNDERAETAFIALDAFRAATNTDADDAMADLLCNLMHYARIECGGFEHFAAMLDRARSNYEAEIEEEGDAL